MPSLPLLIGVNLRGGQFIVGPRGTYVFDLNDVEDASESFRAGTSLGYATPMGASSHFLLELSVLQPVAKPLGDDLVLRLGFGVLFGGYTREEEE